MSVAARVKALIAEHLSAQADDVIESASIIDDLGADSLDTIELMLLLEEEFDVEISDDDAESCRTVGDVVRLIERLGGEPLA